VSVGRKTFKIASCYVLTSKRACMLRNAMWLKWFTVCECLLPDCNHKVSLLPQLGSGRSASSRGQIR
jgi:hypothetical protein